jgi:hypothetical protein
MCNTITGAGISMFIINILNPKTQVVHNLERWFAVIGVAEQRAPSLQMLSYALSGKVFDSESQRWHEKGDHKSEQKRDQEERGDALMALVPADRRKVGAVWGSGF